MGFMSPKLRLGVALLSTGLVFYIALGSYLGRVLGDTTYGQLALFNEVIRIVLDSYLEPVNLDRTMSGADLGLGDALDGDSAYLDASELKVYQQAMQEGGEVGLSVTRRFSFIIVAAVRPGSPADQAHIRPGDVIKSIDLRHSRTLSVPVADSLLRGAPGSVAKLKILRAHNEVADFSLVRERPTALPLEKRMLEEGIGYLKIQEFGAQALEEVEGALESLTRSGAKKLVLDLRGSTSGSVEEAAKVGSAFLKDGIVTKLVSRHSTERTFAVDAAAAKWGGALVVLVDSSTGGPGEVLAAALLDTGRSLVGERTIGRVGVQKTIPVADGAFVLTVAKFVSPKGHEIHGKGLEPQVLVQVKEDADEDEDAPAHNAPDAILLKAIEVVKSGEAPVRHAA
jgi:carboxyl-terminal processing protease